MVERTGLQTFKVEGVLTNLSVAVCGGQGVGVGGLHVEHHGGDCKLPNAYNPSTARRATADPASLGARHPAESHSASRRAPRPDRTGGLRSRTRLGGSARG